MIDYIRATSAEIEFEDGEVRQIGGRAAELLYPALATSGIASEEFDEGEPYSGKRLALLGGRDEFERARQKKIIDWLRSRESPGRPRVLIIGDSIRMRQADTSGYGVHAYRLLIDRFNLTHIPHNCGGTVGVMAQLDDWLSCRPDVVHLNAGLHDLAFYLMASEQLPAFQPVGKYAQNLERIMERIRAANARTIVWGLNTPVQEEWHLFHPNSKKLRKVGRRNADVRKYNDASVQVMQRLGIPVNDLFSPLWEAGVEKVLLPDGVHLNHRGSQIIGQKVADAILEHA